MDAIIFAGGKGSRMEHDLPKPLVPAKGKPILAHQLDYLLSSDKIGKIIIAVGYKAEEIMQWVNKNYPDKSIEFSIEEKPLGTGGALKQAIGSAESDFILVMNCDDFTDIDLDYLSTVRENTICVAHPFLPFGRVLVNDEGYASFEEKPVLDDWVSCGWYVLNRNEVSDLLPENGSLEYEVFPVISLRVHKHEGFWRTINSKKEWQEFEECELPKCLRC